MQIFNDLPTDVDKERYAFFAEKISTTGSKRAASDFKYFGRLWRAVDAK